MTYTIIMILIAVLILCGIVATAVQQHNERKESLMREEISRQKTIYEDTEESIVAAEQMPVSQVLFVILRKRSLNCLKKVYEHNPSNDIQKKIDSVKLALKSFDPKIPPPDHNSFQLPKSDKVIIKYIQAVKKLRMILRSEQSKGHITPKLFMQEDKALEALQLRVNVETLTKRANDANRNSMQGSARQYIEKAITAIGKHKPETEYCVNRKEALQAMLASMESDVKDNNLQSLEDNRGKENKEIDSLFAPKKKW